MTSMQTNEVKTWIHVTREGRCLSNVSYITLQYHQSAIVIILWRGKYNLDFRIKSIFNFRLNKAYSVLKMIGAG